MKIYQQKKLGHFLIAISWIFWVTKYVFGALALQNTDLSTFVLTTATFVLSWIFFVVGVVLAGADQITILRQKLFEMLGIR